MLVRVSPIPLGWLNGPRRIISAADTACWLARFVNTTPRGLLSHAVLMFASVDLELEHLYPDN
jgi:hypothetical protein